MSTRIKSESDGWWRSLLQELLELEKGSDLVGRIVITPGKSGSRLEICAELWRTDSAMGPHRIHTYRREWPHGDHNFMSGACWLAMLAVLRQYDQETLTMAASSDRVPPDKVRKS